jgi:tRNA A-37 threonylcarbamoyl transferase component Bud32
MNDPRLEQLGWIDPLADRFERAWKEGGRPRLEEYLASAPAGEGGALLRELLPVEVYHRRLRGETPTPAEYRIRLPEHDAVIQDVFQQTEAESALATLVMPPPLPTAGLMPTGRWGRYTLNRLQAEGGLGQVWVAQDGDLEREVALKALRPQHADDPRARQRFLREAQLAGQLEHPNIVPVYELSRHPESGQLFYTMRFVRGKTLREAVRDYHAQRRTGKVDPLALPRLLSAFVSVCQAVGFAHAQGVIHRDLKPDNVMVGSFGEVLVLDWGLARTVQEGEAARPGGAMDEAPAERTALGCIVGTPAYMAPEQAEGRTDQIDERTDIYGLGAVLFEVLTGRAPHEGKDTPEVLRHICEGEPRRARAVDPTVPAALDAVCARAMARQRGERYGQASELAQDVQRFLADEPVSVYREGWAQRLGRLARRHWTATMAFAAALAGVVLTSCVAAGGLAYLADQERQARRAAEQAREQGIRVTARFAARTVAQEVALRWSLLGKAGADPQLRRLVEQLRTAERLPQQPASQELQGWLERQYNQHSGKTGTTSWFLTDARGRHLGRHPPAPRVVGQNFAYRDYFHGKGRDLPPGTKGLRPIQDAHCSVVYESQAIGEPLVAFAAPVRGESHNGEREVLAVLAMTVEAGHYGALQAQLGKDQIATLVDTRNDWLEGAPRQGLILHHPRLVELRSEGGPLPVFRVGPDRVQQLEQLRAAEREHQVRQAKLSWQEQLAAPAWVVPGGLDRDYRDPVGGAYGGGWLAAFEPVLVKRPDGAIKDIGWVVIIQERRGGSGRPDAEGEPAR